MHFKTQSKWYGHDYELFVTLKGNINPENGYLLDLKILSQLLEEKLVQKISFKNLNTEVDFLLGKVISLEMLTLEIFKLIKPGLLEINASLHKVRLVAGSDEAWCIDE